MTVVTNRMANFWMSWATGQTGRPGLRSEQSQAVSEGGRAYVLVNHGSLPDGTLYFTVRWLGLKAGTRSRAVCDTSLNFREDDLKLWEVVSDLEIAVRSAHPSVYWRWWDKGKSKREQTVSPQLKLPYLFRR